MALSERSASYQTFEPRSTHQRRGEEVVGEMLSYFPARDVEEPATKEFVRAEIAELRATMHQEFRSMLQWLIASFVAINGLLLAAARLVL